MIDIQIYTYRVYAIRPVNPVYVSVQMNTSLVRSQQIPQEEVEMKSAKTEVRKNRMVSGQPLSGCRNKVSLVGDGEGDGDVNDEPELMVFDEAIQELPQSCCIS